MALTVTAAGGDFEKAPLGTHLARCIRVIDLGTQHEEYKGAKKATHKVVIFWELVNEKMKDDRPFSVSKWYTASLGEKAILRLDLKNWRGREFTPEELEGFSLKNILGKPCQVNIIDKDGRHNVGSVSGIPKGINVPEAVNPLVLFDLSEFNQVVYNGLSDYWKGKIAESDEYIAMLNPSSPGDDVVDDANAPDDDSSIPF